MDLFIQKAENLGFKGGKIRLFPKPTEKCQDQYIISIYSKVLCELILSITDKSKDKLPEFLRNATMECKTEFLRGLFDSDGCVSFGFYKYKGRENYPKLSKSIFLCNENYEFLLFVQEIIDSLGIKSAIREGDGVYNLFISNKAWNVIKFSEIIGFSINRKKEKLRKLIEVIYKQRKTKFKPEEYFETLKLKQEGFSTAEISRKVGINKFTVYDWLYRDVKPRTVES